MKKLVVIGALAFGFVLFGCQNTDNSAEEVEEVVHEDDHHHDGDEDHHHHDMDDEPLSLNDGEKWIINDEMKPHVAAGEEVLKNYIDSESTDYAALAVQLKEKNAGLIGSCTMKGESHDELHKWLYPHIDLLGDLGNAESQEEADEVIDQLGHSFETFHEYFQ